MDKMTVYYNKRLGTIKLVVDGVQDMSSYGDEEEDYKKIYDFIIVDRDMYVHNNYHNMYVTNGEIKLKSVDTPIEYL